MRQPPVNIGTPAPATLQDFVNQCQDLASYICAIENPCKLKTGPCTTNPATTHTPQATFVPTPAPHQPPAAAPYCGPAPIDLSANCCKITPQEHAARLAEGRCLYCAGHGHMAAACPNKPANL